MKLFKIKFLFAFLALAPSTHKCSASDMDLLNKVPILMRVIVTEALGNNNNLFNDHMESCPAQMLFTQTREFATYIQTKEFATYMKSLLPHSPKENTEALEKKCTQLLCRCYEKVFTKAGGRTSLDAIQDQSLGTTDTPLVVRAAHNYAINMSKEDDQLGFAEEIFTILDRKGFAPSKNSLAHILKRKKKAHEENQEMLLRTTTRVANAAGAMGSLVEKFTSPEMVGGIFDSFLQQALQSAAEKCPEITAADIAQISQELRGVGTRALTQMPQHLKDERKNVLGLINDFTAKYADAGRTAAVGDVRGAATIIAGNKLTLPSTSAVSQIQEIPERLLFAHQDLAEIHQVSESIYGQTSPTDTLFFVGRSPLYFSKMLQRSHGGAAIFEMPFSNAGFNDGFLDANGQAAHQRAEEAYRNCLRRLFSEKLNREGRILVIDRYESGRSANKFCDLLNSALGVEAKIIALCGETNIGHQTKAKGDPRVLSTIMIPSGFLSKVGANEDAEGLDSSLGRPFFWSQWENWEEFMNIKASIGNVASARLKQIDAYTL
jgi:hypothetical protein